MSLFILKAKYVAMIR